MEKKCILCVDDEKIILDSLRAQLNRHFGNQFNYEFAESAEEALEILDEFNADDYTVMMIISDWLMPNMKGDEFLLKAHNKFPNVYKLLLTGQADEKAIEKLINGIENFELIHKPWEENKIVDAVYVGMNDAE